MTNLDKWRYVLKDKPSPDTWVDMSWYFIVAACLQRRVWYDNLNEGALFPNLYIVLIGPPATGKNLVLMPAARLLAHWAKDPSQQEMEDNNPAIQRKLLFPMGPDTVTFEKLVERLSLSTEKHVYPDEKGVERIYTYTSMAFVLEELNSLFQRHADKIPKLMLKAFDCGDYTYEIKNGASNYVRKTCMNFIAGATPAILREAAQFHIFDDGFVSRTIFCFEHEPRHDLFHIGETTEEQVAKLVELRNWIRKLKGVFGQLKYDKDVYGFLEDWAAKNLKRYRQTSHPRMVAYYGRKRVHIRKLAAAVHFSEHLDLTITVEDVQRALMILDRIEANMAIGFSAVGRNTLHPISRDILTYIRATGGASRAEILLRFQSDLTVEELDQIMLSLQYTQEIYVNKERYHTS